VTGALREIVGPFVAAAPAGARIRTRLRVTAQDEAVLSAAGRHLGSLAGRDLAARVREGRLDARGTAVSRRERKRALTAQSSSRWAGAITRTSEDQWGLAERNLRAERFSLQARVRRIEARIAVPAGGRSGRLRGYATPAERHGKVIRREALRARLARVERQLESGSISVVRGGRALLRKRENLTAAGLTEAGWRGQWDAARLFLTADGEAGKPWGNETIRWKTPMTAGWRSSSPPRWRTWPTAPADGTGCHARSLSPTGGMRSPPRPPPERSATTSHWTAHPGAGTWTPHGASHSGPRHHSVS